MREEFSAAEEKENDFTSEPPRIATTTSANKLTGSDKKNCCEIS